MAKKTKSKKKAAKKAGRAKQVAQKKAAKKSAMKKPAMKASVGKKVAAAKKRVVKKAAVKTPRIRSRGVPEVIDTVEFEPKGLGARSGGQSGDLQGLSNVAGADSESVDELIEEGNAFEAEVIKGVQDARDADQGEIVTHEVPEDDVPREYDEQ